MPLKQKIQKLSKFRKKLVKNAQKRDVQCVKILSTQDVVKID